MNNNNSFTNLKLGNFSILVENKIVQPNDKRHVYLTNETYFSIHFVNNFSSRLQADVYLNSKVGNKYGFIGTWILNPFQSYSIETYESNGDKFIFTTDNIYENNTYLTSDDYGLISVRFRTEVSKEELVQFNNTRSFSLSKKGAIGLGEQSNQQFKNVAPITEYNHDYIQAVRLVEKVKVKPIDFIPEYEYPI